MMTHTATNTEGKKMDATTINEIFSFDAYDVAPATIEIADAPKGTVYSHTGKMREVNLGHGIYGVSPRTTAEDMDLAMQLAGFSVEVASDQRSDEVGLLLHHMARRYSRPDGTSAEVEMFYHEHDGVVVGNEVTIEIHA